MLVSDGMVGISHNRLCAMQLYAKKNIIIKIHFFISSFYYVGVFYSLFSHPDRQTPLIRLTTIINIWFTSAKIRFFFHLTIFFQYFYRGGDNHFILIWLAFLILHQSAHVADKINAEKRPSLNTPHMKGVATEWKRPLFLCGDYHANKYQRVEDTLSQINKNRPDSFYD